LQGDKVIIHRLIAARSAAGGLARLAIAGAIVASGVLVMAQAAQASWLQVNTAVPAGAVTWGFNDVSCTSPTVCMAVGTAEGSTNQVLAERRSGSFWAVQGVAQPAQGSSLNGISCTSATACITVGNSPKGATGAKPLAERWDGAHWTILGAKDISGRTRTTLTEVSCVSATHCMAVGDSENSSRDFPLAELWNGKSWRIVPTPAGKGTIVSLLSGISCTSATRCIAVGYTRRGGSFGTLAEVWNGKSWKILATPGGHGPSDFFNAISCKAGSCEAVGDGIAARWNGQSWSKLQRLANPGGDSPAALYSVSCTVKRTCYAVGSYDVGGVQTSVAEYWNGSRWTVENAAITTSNDSSGFTGISCTTPTRCTLVGFYHDPVTGNRALAMDFSLRWQDTSPVQLTGVIGSTLGSVSCWSPQTCMAVGSFNTGSEEDTFAEFWFAGGWTAQTTPKAKATDLSGVSCPAKFDCVAVGSIVKNSGQYALVERWNGIAWTIQSTPNPKGTNHNFLQGVSCSSKTACTAVGFATHAGHQVTLAERWNGKKWQIQPTPNPKGGQYLKLWAVSCASTKACTAVGTSLRGKFAETWNGTSWKLHTVPTPTGSQVLLEAVSCTSPSACTAVGVYTRGGRGVPLAERWNGKSWKPQRAVARGASSAFTGVSCTSAGACKAVGTAGNNGLAESWNGKSWTVQGLQKPLAGAQSSGLDSVSCNSATACIGVGSYLSISTGQTMWMEQYS
jgi:hypothetical protein